LQVHSNHPLNTKTNSLLLPKTHETTMTMTDLVNESSLHLKILKTKVPSEYATSSRVRQWLLEHLQNRNIDLLNGPEAFVCLWKGAELHSLHPNHIFGSLISQGIAPQTAHHVVGDIMECLEDYRARRAACIAAGEVWFPDQELEPQSSQERHPNQEQRQRLVQDNYEALSEQSESPPSWYSSLFSARGVLAAGFSLAVGLGVMTWLIVKPSSREEEEK
ncbi:hypothetical protein CT0861_10011, partial [Colletotrichum tofieldiae]